MSSRNVIVRFFSAIWRALDGLRKFLHLVVLLFLFVLVIGAASGTAPVLPDRAVLEIAPAGFLVEEYQGDPFDRALEELVGDAPPQTVVQDIVDALEYAENDERIAGVHLNLGNLAGGGLSKLQRIGEAIIDFRESGKPVIASGDFYSQGGYYLAAHADETYLHPEGLVLLQGYGSYRMYFSEAIEKLRLDWNIFRVGTHKAYVEPYTRMSMSDEAREDITRLTSQLWEMYVSDVALAREIDESAVRRFSDDLVSLVRAAGGDVAKAAMQQGLLDGLATRREIRQRLIEISGEDEEFQDAPATAGIGEYLAQMRLLKGTDVRERNVAVVIAAGEITFGSPAPGTIGGDSTGRLLRRALNDDSVAAVVLRVDSPGGSMFASDVIGNEVAALKSAGKPVIASMGSAAASGGYWISVGSDRIFASPSTVTGSIGLFSMFPTYQRTLDVLGVNVDGTGTTPWYGEFRPDREMSEHTEALLQAVVDDGYQDFLTRVAVFRGMEKSAVDEIAQGRVWTGADAVNLGLVDELGSLEDAIGASAELAGLAEGEYGHKTIRHELSPTEQLILELVALGKAVGIDPAAFSRRPGTLARLAGRLEQELTPLLRFDEPRGVYAHCLCLFE